MWRDILLIVALLIALLSYFQITPSRLLQYIKSTRIKITKRLPEIFYLTIATINTLFSIFVLIYNYEKWQAEIWSYILLFTITNNVLWYIALKDLQRFSGNRMLYIISASVLFLSLIAFQILSDNPIWAKLVYIFSFLIAFGIGFGLRVLVLHIKGRSKP